MAELLELLVQQLSDSSREQRKTAAGRLVDVAVALGPDGVQENLVPILCRKYCISLQLFNAFV